MQLLGPLKCFIIPVSVYCVQSLWSSTFITRGADITWDYKIYRRITLRLQNITVGITWDYKKIAVGIIKITVGITFGITKRRWDYSVITKPSRVYVTVTLGLQYGYVGITIRLQLDYIYIFATRQSGNAKSQYTTATNFTKCNVLF